MAWHGMASHGQTPQVHDVWARRTAASCQSLGSGALQILSMQVVPKSLFLQSLHRRMTCNNAQAHRRLIEYSTKLQSKSMAVLHQASACVCLQSQNSQRCLASLLVLATRWYARTVVVQCALSLSDVGLVGANKGVNNAHANKLIDSGSASQRCHHEQSKLHGIGTDKTCQNIW